MLDILDEPELRSSVVKEGAGFVLRLLESLNKIWPVACEMRGDPFFEGDVGEGVTRDTSLVRICHLLLDVAVHCTREVDQMTLEDVRRVDPVLPNDHKKPLGIPTHEEPEMGCRGVNFVLFVFQNFHANVQSLVEGRGKFQETSQQD
jgi:hypothetical protein